MSNIQQVEKEILILLVKESNFINSIDSLIFNPVYPTFRNTENLYNTFAVTIRKDYMSDSYELYFSLSNEVRIYDKITIIGCFEYNNYFFLIHGTVLEDIFEISNQKKTISYTEGRLAMPETMPEWILKYQDSKFTLTYVCSGN